MGTVKKGLCWLDASWKKQDWRLGYMKMVTAKSVDGRHYAKPGCLQLPATPYKKHGLVYTDGYRDKNGHYQTLNCFWLRIPHPEYQISELPVNISVEKFVANFKYCSGSEPEGTNETHYPDTSNFMNSLVKNEWTFMHHKGDFCDQMSRERITRKGFSDEYSCIDKLRVLYRAYA